MSTQSGILSAEQFAELSDSGERRELINGELRMMSPAGHEHGRLAMRLGWLLTDHVLKHDLGVVYAAETGFLIRRSPDTVRAPDVAFVRHDRLAQAASAGGYLALAPDLVGEVISPNDSFSAVETKVADWLQAGSLMVLLVEPRTQSLHVHRSSHASQILRVGESLDASDAVRGWKLSVTELFR